MEDDDTFFSQKSFALKYVKNYKFNTYRKNRRVSLIVSRMVHYPGAILVTIERYRKSFLFQRLGEDEANSRPPAGLPDI